jgi:hypothetical protein
METSEILKKFTSVVNAETNSEILVIDDFRE